MGTRTEAPPPPQTRRARRAAERSRSTEARRSATATTRSPLVWATAMVGIVAVVVIAAAVLVQAASAPTVDPTGLVSPTTPTPTALADGRALGKANTPVTLEVWSDFQCPACDQYAVIVEPALVGQFVTPGTLRIIHHDAAFQGARSNAPYDESVEAAAGARCAADQDRYWPFHDWLFANQSGENKGAFADGRLRAIATSAGLDVSVWDACRATGEHQAAVHAETQSGVANGIDSTPTMFLNGEKIVGVQSATVLGQKIEAAAAAARS